MRLKLEHLKSPAGIIVAVVVVAALVGYRQWRRSALEKSARIEAERYLKRELPARYLRETRSQPDPKSIDSLKQIQIQRVDLPLFVGKRPRVVVWAVDGVGNQHKVVMRMRGGLFGFHERRIRIE